MQLKSSSHPQCKAVRTVSAFTSHLHKPFQGNLKGLGVCAQMVLSKGHIYTMADTLSPSISDPARYKHVPG